MSPRGGPKHGPSKLPGSLDLRAVERPADNTLRYKLDLQRGASTDLTVLKYSLEQKSKNYIATHSHVPDLVASF